MGSMQGSMGHMAWLNGGNELIKEDKQ